MALITTILIVVPVLLLSKWNETDKNEFVETTSVQYETSSDKSTTSTTITTTDPPVTLKIITRNEWGARNPAKKINLTEPASIIFISQESDFGACMTKVR